MRVNEIIITASEINSLGLDEFITKDVRITLDNGQVVSPREVLIINSTGTLVGITNITDDLEELERIAHPEWYIPIPLDSGKSIMNLGISPDKIIITRLSLTSAVGDLSLYFANYYS